MKLYFSPGVCSLSPHIVLEESGLPFETEQVDLRKKTTASGADYSEINPKGYVPALVLDNGVLLTEGPAIVQYLADQVPDKQLAPANGTLARYQLQSWLTFIGTEVHKSFTPFFKPDSTPEMKDAARANLERRLGYINTELAGREYLLPEGYSVADIYLFVVLGWARLIKLDLTPWPQLQAFQARVGARPAVQRALKAEGLA
ncbi:glutathione transferase GstA [Aquabacterium olei]|uniref:Glutathione transferase GstA n=1 Tax=Aquabacterium olei TaxID=1296669 RepID=A0A2U8FWT1_9BURK|nr:glutathione transferase GstA [Aquabacterium olei]AWI54894.1 glutathione transferase GstA [Aquabacterium olei]